MEKQQFNEEVNSKKRGRKATVSKEEKMIRNRLAAKRCRLEKKQKIEHTEKELVEVKKELEKAKKWNLKVEEYILKLKNDYDTLSLDYKLLEASFNALHESDLYSNGFLAGLSVNVTEGQNHSSIESPIDPQTPVTAGIPLTPLDINEGKDNSPFLPSMLSNIM